MTATSRGGVEVSPQQARIIDRVLTAPVTIASAGAGSGKTHTMVAAIMTILEAGMDPAVEGLGQADDLAVVTFTTSAAEMLRRRLEDTIDRRVAGTEARYWLAQRERLSAAFVGTIHAYAHRLLRGFGYGGGVPRSSAMSRSSAVLRECLSEEMDAIFAAPDSPDRVLLGLEAPEHVLLRLAEDVLDHLSRIGLSPPDMLAETDSLKGAGSEVRSAFARLVCRAHDRYQRAKVERGAVDVDDLLLRLRQALKDDPAAAEGAAARHHLLFIDEFQDTDRVQLDLVHLLRPHLRRLLVVGDIKQSIYGFRAADAKLLEELADQTDTPILPLNVSRRPTRELLEAQNKLFSVIGQRYAELRQGLEPYEESPTSPTAVAPLIHDTATRDEAPGAIARWIRYFVGTPIVAEGGLRPAEPADIVLLCRTNRQVDDLTTRVSAALRPPLRVRQARGESFFEQSEVVATYRVLQVLLRPDDDAALAMALDSIYFPHVDAAERILEIAQYRPQGSPLTDWFRRHHPADHGWISACRRSARTDTAPQLLARVYRRSGIIDRLNGEGRADRAAVLEDLREEARNLFRNEQALTLDRFVDWLRVAVLQGFRTARERGTIRRPDHVRAMTIHQSKGLEYPIVIIPRIDRPLASDFTAPAYLLHDSGALDVDLPTRTGGRTRSPSWSAQMEQHRDRLLEEEMRLLYVAATRAEQHVVLVGERGRPGLKNPPSNTYYSWLDEINVAHDLVPVDMLLPADGPSSIAVEWAGHDGADAAPATAGRRRDRGR